MKILLKTLNKKSIILLSFTLVLFFSTTAIEFYLLINRVLNQPVAYNAYYDVYRPKYKTKSKVRIESYFENGFFNIYTSIYEVGTNGIIENIDILNKGSLIRENNDVYYFQLLEQDILLRANESFLEKDIYPISHSMFNSKNRLAEKNITKILKSNDRHVTVFSFRNNEQILSFYRY